MLFRQISDNGFLFVGHGGGVDFDVHPVDDGGSGARRKGNGILPGSRLHRRRSHLLFHPCK